MWFNVIIFLGSPAHRSAVALPHVEDGLLPSRGAKNQMNLIPRGLEPKTFSCKSANKHVHFKVGISVFPFATTSPLSVCLLPLVHLSELRFHKMYADVCRDFSFTKRLRRVLCTALRHALPCKMK